MKKTELFYLKLNESKDVLMHVNDSIRETRNRLFFILAFVFAIFGYLIEDVLNFEYTSKKSLILYSLVLLIGFILYQCRHAITPLKLRFNGIEPKSFNQLKGETKKSLQNKILHTYQKSIDINGAHLLMISRAYNRAFYSILIWLFSVCLFLILEWVVQRYI